MMPKLVPGFAYYLEGIPEKMWDIGHPKFGKPRAISGRYLGLVSGKRRWHVFEIWVGTQEEGAIIISQEDLLTVSVRRLVDNQ
jgi:hypothetical protein